MESQHIACICDAGPSHVMAFAAIGCHLQRRGHRVTVFQAPELAKRISAAGLEFACLPSHGFSVQRYIDLINQQQGFSVRNFLDYSIKSAIMLCEEAPRAFRSAAVDGVMVDISQPGGATAAEAAGLPFVTICNALPLHSEPAVPPDFLPWRFRNTWWAKIRNTIAYGVRNLAISPLHRTLNGYRRKWNLRPYRRPEDSFSALAQITQLVPEFDFPRKNLPAHFHYVGPYSREPERDVPFPFERLDGRPIIYASLGTVFGGRADIWRAIVQGCSALEAQLIISLGGRAQEDSLPHLPRNAIVANYAPQRKILSIAALTITHAGLNSVMEAIAAGVPLIAIPITGDQFGVAARVAYTHIGEIIPAGKCKPWRVSAAARRILGNASCRQHEAVIHKAIEQTDGAASAAAIVEQVIATRRPVAARSVSVS